MVYHGRNTSYIIIVLRLQGFISLLVLCVIVCAARCNFLCWLLSLCIFQKISYIPMWRHMCVTSPHVTCDCGMVVTSSHVKCSFARKQTWGIRWPLWRLKLRLPLICEKKCQNISINQMHFFLTLFSRMQKSNTKFSLTHFVVKA